MKATRHSIVAVAVLLLVLAGLSWYLTFSSKPAAQRLHLNGKENGRGLSDYDKGKSVELTVLQIKEIGRLLEASPESLGKKRCIIEYGVLFTIPVSNGFARVALCFNCNELGVYEKSDDDPPKSERSFDAVRNQFLAITKEVFPDDPEIKALR